MEQKKKKPAQLDKNGNPVRRPAKPANKSRPAGKPAAKPKRAIKPAAPAQPEYPMDWFFFHPEEYSVRQLQEVLSTVPNLDIEIWPELGILEATFPSKTFVDFERTEELPQEPALQAFLASHPCKSAYYVSVEPACHGADLAFLRETAAKTGGILVADTDGLSPIFGIYTDSYEI